MEEKTGLQADEARKLQSTISATVMRFSITSSAFLRPWVELSWNPKNTPK